MLYTEQEKQIVKQMVDEELAIKKTPESALKECLSSITKDRLLKIRDANHLTGINNGQKKAEIIDKLADALSECVLSKRDYLSKEQAEAVRELRTDGTKSLSFEEVLEQDFLFPLLDQGWLFLYKKKDTYRFVLPKEWKDLLKDHDDTKRQVIQKEVQVLTAMIHLYGVFTPDFFLKNWNKQYPMHRLTEEELAEQLPLISSFSLVIQTDGELIFHKKYLLPNEAKQVHALAQSRKPYSASKDDFDYFANHLYDDRSAEYQRFRQFLASFVPEDLMPFVEERFALHLKLSTPLQHFIDVFNEQKIPYPMERLNQEFTDVYMPAVNQARRWTMAGNLPEPSKPKPQVPKKKNTAPVNLKKKRKKKKIVRKR